MPQRLSRRPLFSFTRHSVLRAAFAVLLAWLCGWPAAHAGSNAFKEQPGAKDHPLISRFKGSILHAQGSINFERVEFPVSATEKSAVEGKVFNYSYVAPLDRGDLEVFRSFKQALEGDRFKIVLACDEPKKCQDQRLDEHAELWTGMSTTFARGYDPLARMSRNGNYPPRFLVAQLQRAEGDVTVILTVKGPSSTEKNSGVGAPYFLQVIESAAMQKGNVTVTVAADALGKGLAAEGKMALYGVFFDTGLAVLKPESKAQLDEMAKLLSQNKALKVFIVGHTDNQGAIDGNIALSQKRAEAVVAALAGTYKIDAQRLQARGVANFAPLASNASEAGRAKNRRVELVAQ